MKISWTSTIILSLIKIIPEVNVKFRNTLDIRELHVEVKNRAINADIYIYQ